MTDGFIHYGSPHSQFTYEVALMLRLSGQPIAFRYISFQREMHRIPEFLVLSRRQVPIKAYRTGWLKVHGLARPDNLRGYRQSYGRCAESPKASMLLVVYAIAVDCDIIAVVVLRD